MVKRYNQIPGIDFTGSHSPVATDVTIRTFLVAAIIYGWNIEQFDVETAFMYGNLDEKIYLEKPDGYNKYSGDLMDKNEVLMLEKSLYGLVQAARAWLKTFIKHLMEVLSFERSMADPCLLLKKDKKSRLVLVVIVYVDDCAVGGEPQWIQWFGKEVGK